MDEPDRRTLVTALDAEPGDRLRQVLATPESLSDWLRDLDQPLHHRLGPELSTIHAWLRMAYP